MRRTPKERARRLWIAAAIVAVVGVAVAVAAAAVPSGALGDSAVGTAALGFAAPLAFVAALLLCGIAATRATPRPEAAWIVTGILIFWVSNSALYLDLLRRADNELDDVPSQALIDLLSALFTAGIVALIAAGLIAVLAWVLRPGRWHALNGPGGQS